MIIDHSKHVLLYHLQLIHYIQTSFTPVHADGNTGRLLKMYQPLKKIICEETKNKIFQSMKGKYRFCLFRLTFRRAIFAFKHIRQQMHRTDNDVTYLGNGRRQVVKLGTNLPW